MLLSRHKRQPKALETLADTPFHTYSARWQPLADALREPDPPQRRWGRSRRPADVPTERPVYWNPWLWVK